MRRVGGPPTPRHAKLSPALAPGEDVLQVTPSPDGARVAFTVQDASQDQRLYAVPIDGSAPARLLSRATHAVAGYRFAPGGARLVYVARDAATGTTRVFSVLADGSAAPVKLNGPLVPGGNVVSGGADTDPSFALSPDGQWVAYLADQLVDERFELFLRRIDGSGSPVVVNDPLVAGGDVAAYGQLDPAFRFTKDSTGIVYLADQESDEVVELFLRSFP